MASRIGSGDEMAISDLEARQIAAEWHGGQFSALYSFQSTGNTRGEDGTSEDLLDEINGNLEHVNLTPEHFDEPELEAQRLADLYAYVVAVGPRGPVPGWADRNRW